MAIKVMRIIARLNVGGPSIHVVLLTRGLEPEYETVLVCGTEADYEGSMKYYADEMGVKPVIVEGLGREIHPLKDLIALWQLFRLMCRERPAIVHTHTAKAGTLGRIAAKLAGVPVLVHTFHGHVFHSYFGPLKTKLFLMIEAMLARWTHRIIVLSERQKNEICGFGVCEPSRISIVPLGLDFNRLLAGGRDLRASWGVSPSETLVGIVGRLTSVKNHEMFLRVVRRFQGREGVKFVIVGDGERRDELEQQARQLGVEGMVRFVGWEKDMASVYKTLDIVALTSRNEGTPLCLIEAMIAGKPVVATGVGGVPDIVESGETGFVVPLDDDEAMADVIDELLSDPERAAEIGSKARRRAEERFHADRLVRDIRALYAELLITVQKH